MPSLSITCNRNVVTTSSPDSASLSPRVATPGGSLFLRSPISPTRNNSLNITNIHDVTEKNQEVCPYAFRPPTANDSRGPCPALNTLANHGYLPHDGRDITREQFLAALENPETYHLSTPLAQVLVQIGFCLMHKCTSRSLSLYDLAQHGLIEHDASLVHKDTEPGHKYAPTRCDTILLNELLEDGPLDLEKVASKREELERAAPLDVLHQELARGEWALVLDIFGREHGGKIAADLLKVWLNQNRFPDGWRPSHEQGLLATVSKAGGIRTEMKKCQKEHETSAVVTDKNFCAASIPHLCRNCAPIVETASRSLVAKANLD